MAEVADLVVVPKESALQVFTQPDGLAPYLAAIRAEVATLVPDTSSKKGRDAIASMAYKVAKVKAALDDYGKNLAAEYKDVPKKIDANRKAMRDDLDSLKDETRKPLTDWEEAEQTRIDAHKSAIAGAPSC